MATKPPLQTLLGLLGKEVKDALVQEVLAQAGKVKVTSDHVVAKDADFEFALTLPIGKKTKVLSTLFVGAESEQPEGFEIGITRAAQLARLPPPMGSWENRKGAVPVDNPEVHRDTWERDGLEILASYKDGKVRRMTVSLPKDALGGGTLMTHPLDFATKPPDAVEDAPLTGMALLVAWAIETQGLPPKHANEVGKRFAARQITPRRFLIDACNKTLTTLDVPSALAAFLSAYTGNTSHNDRGARAPTDAAIKALLKLDQDDRCTYADDFCGTFQDVLESPFHVSDTWEAVDRIAPVLAARATDFAATGFLTSPDLALYEAAARARDARPVTPERRALAKVTVDDSLGEALVGLIGRSLKDKAVKEVLTRAGLPVGKTIDEQATPALGVAYMGNKFEIDGKHTLGVDYVTFYAAKQVAYIRGIGAKVEFAGYAGALPHGLRIGMPRTEVVAALGTPNRSDFAGDFWNHSATRRIHVMYVDDVLVMARFGRPS